MKFGMLAFLLLASHAAVGQETLRSSEFSVIVIHVQDRQGRVIPLTAIRVSGPVEREFAADNVARPEVRLRAGRYILTVQPLDLPPSSHTLTVIGGIRYELLLTLGFPPDQSRRPTRAVSTLGPFSVTRVTIDSDGTVRYGSVNNNQLLTFRRLEITRLFADGSSHVGIHEHDAVEIEAITALQIGFGLRSFWTHSGSAEHVQLAKDVGRWDVPVAAQVRVAAIATADEPPFGDQATIAKLIARRSAMVTELGYWITELAQAMSASRGVLLADLLLEQLAEPRPRETTAAYRVAMRTGLETFMRGVGRNDAEAERRVENLAMAAIQFHDAATDQLRLLEQASRQ